MGKVVLIRGCSGVGKTTICKLLSSKMPKVAFINVDKLRNMVSDREITPEQMTLGVQNAAILAKNFIAHGYDVLIEHMFEESSDIDLVCDTLKSEIPVILITLKAPLHVLIQRDKSRDEYNRLNERVEYLNNLMEASNEKRGLFIDTSLGELDKYVNAIQVAILKNDGKIN